MVARRYAAAWIAATVITAAPTRTVAQDIASDHHSWHASHVALAGAFAIALWMDAAQTREAMRRGYQEMNPVLGPHPSVGQINRYTAVAGLGVLTAAAVAPRRVRPWLLGVALAVETFAIAGNARAGLSVKFP